MRLPALGLALLAVQPLGALAQEADTFAVEGQVVNRTVGGRLPAGLQVRVVAFTDGRTLGSWEGVVDVDGDYRIEGVARSAGATYIVGTDHSGVSYVDRFEPGGQASTVAPLDVFDSVPEDPGIRLERSAWIVSEIDPARQTVSMLEVHSLVNPADRTFLPRADGAGGPSGLLVFGLPAHAFALTPRLGLTSEGIVQIDRGFASLAPIRPGRTEIAFSYQFPYSESSYPFRRTLRYPVESLRVLAPTNGPTLRADGFEAIEGAMVGERPFRELRSGALIPGAVVTVNLEGLPARSALAAPIPPGAVGLGGAAAGVGLVIAAWWRTRSSSRLALSDEDLLNELAALELDRAAGRIGDQDYEATRARLIARGIPETM